MMPALPSLGERGVPPDCQPLAGDVPCLLVSAGDVLARDVRGAPVVAALAFGDLGEGRQAEAADAAQPLLTETANGYVRMTETASRRLRRDNRGAEPVLDRFYFT